ncbi:MAG: transcriptional regulator BetI [Alphaproteobacteria bacterium]|nr:transcriptional regulator BetI [Alphaproteobacteria bacterium]
MPKVGMEPIRRDALVKATIAEIGRVGSLDVTVAEIARSAGMSPALAHHYFGGKEQIFLAAMRHVLRALHRQVAVRLRAARGDNGRRHHARLVALIRTNFDDENYTPAVIAAWLNFYVLAQTSVEANRLLRVYHGRLLSNLRHDLRPIVGGRAEALAVRLGALIDGVYLRQALGDQALDGKSASALVIAALDAGIAEANVRPE